MGAAAGAVDVIGGRGTATDRKKLELSFKTGQLTLCIKTDRTTVLIISVKWCEQDINMQVNVYIRIIANT